MMTMTDCCFFIYISSNQILISHTGAFIVRDSQCSCSSVSIHVSIEVSLMVLESRPSFDVDQALQILRIVGEHIPHQKTLWATVSPMNE
jgi:hypothetical protein